MQNPTLDKEAYDIICEILKRGNNVEIRKRKDGIVILEVTGKLKKVIPYNN